MPRQPLVYDDMLDPGEAPAAPSITYMVARVLLRRAAQIWDAGVVQALPVAGRRIRIEDLLARQMQPVYDTFRVEHGGRLDPSMVAQLVWEQVEKWDDWMPVKKPRPADRIGYGRVRGAKASTKIRRDLADRFGELTKNELQMCPWTWPVAEPDRPR